MAEETKIPTREKCKECVLANRGKLNEAGKDLMEEMIAALAKECGDAREACALAQLELESLEVKDPEVDIE